MVGYTLRRYFCEQWRTIPHIKAVDDVRSKTFVVTGSNVGLGLEAAVHLAKMQPKLIVATSRDLLKCELSRKSILERAAENGALGTELYTWPLELGSFQNVRTFVDKFATEGNGTLNALVANAGVLPGEDYTQTQDGWEITLQVNYLSTALLSILLLPYLVNSSSPNSPSRLVVASSFVHHLVSELKASDPQNSVLDTINQPNFGDSLTRYQVSKFLGVIFIRELTSRLSDPSSVIACAVNPGFCDTGITRHQEKGRAWSFYIMKKFAFVRSIEEGSRTLVHAAVVSDHSMRGRYLTSCEVDEENSFLSTPEGKACSAKVWDETIALLSEIDGRVTEIVEKFLRADS